MTEPERLRHGAGAAARLLRSAEVDVPAPRSRRRALAAAASAATTLAAAGSSAALSGGAALKSALVWLCAGALAGTAVGGAASYLGSADPEPARPPLAQPSPAPAPAVVPESRDPANAAEPVASAVEAPVGISSAKSGAAVPRRPPAEPIATPAAVALAEGSSVASFTDAGARPGLFEELKWLETARSAAGRGDFGGVLSTLDRYDQGYPGGHFRPESLALRIEALARLGQREQAAILADRFRRSYPAHPMLGRVRAAVGE